MRSEIEKGNQVYFQEEDSWFKCVGEIQPNTVTVTHSNHVKIMQAQENSNSSVQTLVFHQHASFAHKSKDTQEQSFKRQRKTEQPQEEDDNENSSSNQIKSKKSDSKQDPEKGKSGYLFKQHIYSKNYRQRKKEKVKFLEEENEFLKKKIQDLEFRLREMELEVNRLKFFPDQKDYTVEQLNNEFIEKVTLIMEKNKDDPTKFKSKYDPTDPFYSEFMDTYALHGFGGSKKIEIINYYFNEILEAMMRDSERYFCLMCLNVKSGYELKGFPDQEIISSVFFEIFKPDEVKLKRLEFFSVNLHPLVLEFFGACKEFESKFKLVLKSMNRIHEFMRTNYPSNFDFARMRIVDLEAWFDKQKYTKMMRNLRVMWLEELKKDAREEVDHKRSNGPKKKKTDCKEERD